MKKNLELILLIINWVIVAIQAFTIFLYGNSIGLIYHYAACINSSSI